MNKSKKSRKKNNELAKLITPEFEREAASLYDNPSCRSVEEFYDDLGRVVCVKKLLDRYKVGRNRTHERMVVNHLIALANVFGPAGSIRLVLLKTPEKFWPCLKSIWMFLQYTPDPLPQGHPLFDVRADQKVGDLLREL